CEVTDARRISLRRMEPVRQALYRRAAAVVAPDPQIAAWFAARGANARAIPNPLVPPDKPAHYNSGERRRIVSLGRLAMEKRPELLLRAFAVLARRFPEWDLELYGVGPQQNFLEHLAEASIPAGRIRFCGFTNDPYGALA